MIAPFSQCMQPNTGIHREPSPLRWWKRPLLYLQIHGYCLNGYYSTGGVVFCPPSGSTINIERWEFALYQALCKKAPSDLGISEWLREGLLIRNQRENDNDNDNDNDDPSLNVSTNEFPLKGLPTPPYYKVLARRVWALQEQQEKLRQSTTEHTTLLDNLVIPYFAVPARALGFAELQSPTLDSLPTAPTIATVQSISEWLQKAGDAGVLRLLGMRQTVGTQPMLPPSRSTLLQAANQPHTKGHGKLSVAARARAKHAHRGAKDQFFGTATGPPEKQSRDAAVFVRRILEEAVWINSHVFGNIHETIWDAVLECRLANGYGARWTIAATTAAEDKQEAVEFRGFLEPQMANGHEKGWKH
jgi:hypothetical protein